MDFNENEVAYLEMIQSVITRMAQNSFLIKGWTITLIAALSAFSSLKTPHFAVCLLLMVIGFWYLDAFFLKTERQYRTLYGQAVSKQNTKLFNLAVSAEIVRQHPWYKSMFSITLTVFYGVILIAVLLFYLLSAN